MLKGKIVEFPVNGETGSGYLTIPESGSGKGIILIQEWWGLVPHIKEVADRLANEGYVVLAPDMYHGQTASSPDDAQKLAMAVKIDQVEKDLRGSVDHLLSLDATTSDKVGVVGFCMGGALSLYAACINPKIAACIVYYGIHPEVKNKIENLNVPVLGFFAEKDKGVTPERVNTLENQLKDAGKDYKFITYPDAQHAFFNDSRPAYNPDAATDSWTKMLEFYAEHIM